MDLIKIFLAGGPVMWPILGLSILGLAILIWKGFELKSGSKNPKGLVVLGILGTVTGIIQTFSALHGNDGVANPLSATSGIGEALITTAAGLIASLILLFPYNVISEKCDD